MKTTVAVLSFFLCLFSVVKAAEPTKAESEAFTRLMNSIISEAREDFIKDGEPAFQKLTQEQLSAVSAQLKPRLEEGYETTYLGALTRQGYHVTLWRIQFKDGKDDALATLSMKDGKVGGFFVR